MYDRTPRAGGVRLGPHRLGVPVALHNRVEGGYLRRKFPRWRSFGLNVWLSHDNQVRGIASLGKLGLTEVQGGLSRWPTTLRRISSDDLRVEIYHVVKPSVISLEGSARGRYWPRRASIRPCQEISVCSMPGLNRDHDEPMPILL